MIFEWKGHDLQVRPHADEPQPKRVPDAVLSILGALSPRMGPLRLGMNPIMLRVQPGVEFFFIGAAHAEGPLGDDQRGPIVCGRG